MADKEVHVTRDSGGVGTGLIAGILIAALLAIGVIFFAGGLDGDKDINVNLETPELDAPRIDVPKPDAG
jgi:hypothetical protein